MMKEILPIKQPAKYRRRWFSDEYFDLIVWMDRRTAVCGFQLCYDKNKAERALTWTIEKGFRHECVDDGEDNPAKNLTPILVPDGVCPIHEITALFLRESIEIDPDIASFVAVRLKEYESRSDKI